MSDEETCTGQEWCPVHGSDLCPDPEPTLQGPVGPLEALSETLRTAEPEEARRALREALHKAYAAGYEHANALERGYPGKPFPLWLKAMTDLRTADECPVHDPIGMASPEDCIYVHPEKP